MRYIMNIRHLKFTHKSFVDAYQTIDPGVGKDFRETLHSREVVGTIEADKKRANLFKGTDETYFFKDWGKKGPYRQGDLEGGTALFNTLWLTIIFMQGPQLTPKQDLGFGYIDDNKKRRGLYIIRDTGNPTNWMIAISSDFDNPDPKKRKIELFFGDDKFLPPGSKSKSALTPANAIKEIQKAINRSGVSRLLSNILVNGTINVKASALKELSKHTTKNNIEEVEEMEEVEEDNLSSSQAKISSALINSKMESMTPAAALRQATEDLENAKSNYTAANNAMIEEQAKIQNEQNSAEASAAKVEEKKAQEQKNITDALEAIPKDINASMQVYASIQNKIDETRTVYFSVEQKQSKDLIEAIEASKEAHKKLQKAEEQARNAYEEVKTKTDLEKQIIYLNAYKSAIQNSNEKNMAVLSALEKVKNAYRSQHPENDEELRQFKGDLTVEMAIAEGELGDLQETVLSASEELESAKGAKEAIDKANLPEEPFEPMSVKDYGNYKSPSARTAGLQEVREKTQQLTDAKSELKSVEDELKKQKTQMQKVDLNENKEKNALLSNSFDEMRSYMSANSGSVAIIEESINQARAKLMPPPEESLLQSTMNTLTETVSKSVNTDPMAGLVLYDHNEILKQLEEERDAAARELEKAKTLSSLMKDRYDQANQAKDIFAAEVIEILQSGKNGSEKNKQQIAEIIDWVQHNKDKTFVDARNEILKRAGNIVESKVPKLSNDPNELAVYIASYNARICKAIEQSISELEKRKTKHSKNQKYKEAVDIVILEMNHEMRLFGKRDVSLKEHNKEHNKDKFERAIKTLGIRRGWRKKGRIGKTKSVDIISRYDSVIEGLHKIKKEGSPIKDFINSMVKKKRGR